MTVSEIKEIFSSLEKHNTYHGKLEKKKKKLRIFYLSSPVDPKIRLKPKGNEDVDIFNMYDILNFQKILKAKLKI